MIQVAEAASEHEMTLDIVPKSRVSGPHDHLDALSGSVCCRGVSNAVIDIMYPVV